MASSWTAPRTWTSATLTAAQMNLDVRDNTTWLATDKPNWYLARTAVQSIPNSTVTAISFDSETIDAYGGGGMHSNSTNPSRVTVPVAGNYLVGLYGNFDVNSTGYRLIEPYYNGSAIGAPMVANGFTGVNTTVAVTWFIRCAAGAYLEMKVQQTSGGNLDVTPYFWGFWFNS